MCGEHYSYSYSTKPYAGSSPRVWGTLYLLSAVTVRVRFIPTCVGNTLRHIITRRIVSVHPHVCGEHETLFSLCRDFRGSSPRVWGTQPPIYCLRLLFRFIPTCVGNTIIRSFSSSSATVHPHVCGEHHHILSERERARGSSPRVWGTQVNDC